MKTIWKLSLEGDDGQLKSLIVVPRVRKWLFVERQQGVLCAWAEVNPSTPSEEIGIEVIGTGHPVPNNAQHLLSFQSPPFVWHLYEYPQRTVSAQ